MHVGGSARSIAPTLSCFAAVGLLSLALSTVGTAQTQVVASISALPHPTGPHSIGTRVFYWTDGSRADHDFPAGRPISVQIWYPAAPAAGTARFAPYLIEPGLLASFLAQGYYGQDTVTLSAWSSLPTHSSVEAPIAPGRFPLLSFSVGLGVARANYTSLAEELASQGVMVAAVEGPLAGVMQIPDGRVLFDSTGATNDAAFHRASVSAWSRDISYLLDRLSARHPDSSVAWLAKAVDWHRVGAFGHSTGGLVALATCINDRRVHPCVDMDGGFATPEREPLAEFVPQGIHQPALMLRSQPIYSDSDLARRGLTRQQWEARGAGGKAAMDSLVAMSPKLQILSVAGTGHFNFSDGPFVMPTTITRFGGKIIDPTRGWEIITSVLREYFTDQWGSHPTRFPGSLLGRYPELTATH